MLLSGAGWRRCSPRTPIEKPFVPAKLQEAAGHLLHLQFIEMDATTGKIKSKCPLQRHAIMSDRSEKAIVSAKQAAELVEGKPVNTESGVGYEAPIKSRGEGRVDLNLFLNLLDQGANNAKGKLAFGRSVHLVRQVKIGQRFSVDLGSGANQPSVVEIMVEAGDFNQRPLDLAAPARKPEAK